VREMLPDFFPNIVPPPTVCSMDGGELQQAKWWMRETEEIGKRCFSGWNWYGTWSAYILHRTRLFTAVGI